MNELLDLINAGTCGLISIALMGAVVSKRVHDGVIIKAGLISMCLGFGSIALRLFDDTLRYHVIGLERSLLLINAGIAVVVIGYLYRRARAHHELRRVTDFGDFDPNPSQNRR